MNRTQFYTAVQNYLDSTGADANASSTTSTPRWNSATILAVGSIVFQEEWSNILDQNQAYRLNTVSVTTDSSGRIAISDLSTGSADAKKNFYRVLSGPTDGLVLYRETDFRNVPLGTSANYQAPWDYLYYLAGSDYFQLLPVASGTALTVVVNWTPQTLSALSGDSVAMDFPSGSEYVIVWETAGRLLLKGGSEAEAANALFALAAQARKNMMGQIARLTTRPSSLMFSDLAAHWGGA